ncbi:uncharacterized protein BYT42DRAFT_11768 [Radiomyces spectabilis]|uniref:uncharacterized protein n=1 Tax=Radiomyces spectabilis TaxID=64574 RepID=UPI00221E977F|nr:uncharacterized protein BYT42DRAFT_11768 [Radiomyces spectabilis]KAI8393563.1 hypothetical protein BYT42DRAFT_11768 [Radiomyces spectabilis]
MQRVNSNMLDKIVVQSLREKLWQATRKTVSAFLAREPLDLTEKGATQLIFDVYFLSIVLNDDGMTTTENAQITTKAKQAVSFPTKNEIGWRNHVTNPWRHNIDRSH